MRDRAQLPADGDIKPWVIVAVKIRPDGRICIQILAAFDIPQHGAAAGGQHDGFPFQPVPHLGERVPNVAVIELSEGVH